MKIELAFLKTLGQHHLIPPPSTVIVAISGGADSLALLHLLYKNQHSLNCTLHVATLDHGLRGEAGAEDAMFVVEIAQVWGLEVTAGKADVPALANQRGLGTEAAARIARYNFLAEVAQKVGADRVAVAHHADDQAETVLMHLLRGAGLVGLSGMGYSAPLPGHPDLLLIRPLLDVTRAEIEAYCLEHNLQPRQDATNEDTTYTRNRLRHEVLPSLETLYPQVNRSLVQLADIASVENDFVDQQFEARILPVITRIEGRILIARSLFYQEHPALQRRFIRWAAQQLGKSDDLAYEHILSAIEIVLRGNLGAIALLPNGLQMRVGYEDYAVERRDAPFSPFSTPLLLDKREIPVAIPGETDLGNGWKLHAIRLPTEEKPPVLMHPVSYICIPPDSQVILRTRRAGDHFKNIGGMSKKLSKWMSDGKIPRAERDYIPLLEVNGMFAGLILVGVPRTLERQFYAFSGCPHVVFLWLESPN